MNKRLLINPIIASCLLSLLIACTASPNRYKLGKKIDRQPKKWGEKLYAKLPIDTNAIYISRVLTADHVEYYSFMRFFSNGRAYISKPYRDSLPSDYDAFDVWDQKYDYEAGTKCYYRILKRRKNPVLKIETYISSIWGYQMQYAYIKAQHLQFYRRKRRGLFRPSTKVQHRAEKKQLELKTHYADW